VNHVENTFISDGKYVLIVEGNRNKTVKRGGIKKVLDFNLRPF